MKLPYLYPDGQVLLRALEGFPLPGHAAYNLATSRSENDEFAPQRLLLDTRGLPEVSHSDGVIGGVQCRVYLPEVNHTAYSSRHARRILHIHGGGFTEGSLLSHDAVCHYLAALTGFSITAIDYRLAPEYPFPAAVEDVCTVFDEMVNEGPPIALVGDSAGANLVSALLQSDQGSRRTQVDAAVLVYPGFAIPESDAARALGEAYALPEAARQYYLDAYVPRSEDRERPEVNPFNGKFTGLPRTLVITAECDPLAEAGRRYAAAIAAAGGEVVLSEFAGVLHGFWRRPATSIVARSANQLAASFLRGA